jgi:hypothetical protein
MLAGNEAQKTLDQVAMRIQDSDPVTAVQIVEDHMLE